MGILLATALKFSSVKNSLNIDGRMAAVTLRLNRVKKDVQRMTDSMDKQKKAYLNNLKYWKSTQTQGLMEKAAQAAQLAVGSTEYSIFCGGGVGLGSDTTLTQDQQNAIAKARMEYQKLQANMEAQYTAEEQRIEDYYERLKEAQLEPLKDLEEQLELEKTQLEEEKKFADAEKKFADEMFSKGAENLFPKYA